LSASSQSDAGSVQVEAFALYADLVDRDRRASAATALAARFGGHELIIFLDDAEVGAALPAPGFGRTLRNGRAWRQFLERCAEAGEYSGDLPWATGDMRAAAVCEQGAYLLVIGGAPRLEEIRAARYVLPLVAAALRGERAAEHAEVQARLASEGAAQATRLTASLDAARARLQTALRSSEEANQVKASFLATMSHELRTPLNAMIGYTGLLLMGVPEAVPAAAQKQIERIRLSAHHLLQLIEEILTFARVEAGREMVNPEVVDVADLIHQVGAMIEPLVAEKNLRLIVSAPETALVIQTDPRKVRQVLINLIGNAIKFTEQGEIEFSATEADGEAVIRIRDTGIGIALEHIERVFEPFWQIENRKARRVEGTGLGLSVTRELARLLGGDVTVESAAGAGSTFTLRLPA
jgi:signal transduction histidine kinase